MATKSARLSLEEMLTGEDFVDPLPMGEFAGEFGERELADLLVDRQKLRGRPEIPIRSTGLYGRDVVRAAKGEGSRAAAAGLMAASARSRRISDFEKAAFLRQRQEQAAESAAKQAQRRLKSRALETLGGFAEEGVQLLEESIPGIQQLAVRKKAEKAEKEALAKKTIEHMARGVDVKAAMFEEAMGGIARKGLTIPGMSTAGRFGRGIERIEAPARAVEVGFTEYTIPGDETYEYARNEQGEWLTRKVGSGIPWGGAYNLTVKKGDATESSAVRALERSAVERPAPVSGSPGRLLYGKPRLDVAGESFWNPSAGRYESLLGPAGSALGFEGVGVPGSGLLEFDEIQAGLNPVGLI
jgi:hypothetical protein